MESGRNRPRRAEAERGVRPARNLSRAQGFCGLAIRARWSWFGPSQGCCWAGSTARWPGLASRLVEDNRP